MYSSYDVVHLNGSYIRTYTKIIIVSFYMACLVVTVGVLVHVLCYIFVYCI